MTKKIVIVGGGYAGLYAAREFQRLLRKGEAEVTVVDPRPYFTYQPFLPEVVAGSIEPRHTVVSHRKHLKKSTKIVTAKVTAVSHAKKKVTVVNDLGTSWDIDYDVILFTAGAVSRTFPIPGVAENAIGLKTVEEARDIRDRLIRNFDTAASMPAGAARDRLLTFVVVGGGFAGIEVYAEMRNLASYLLRKYPELTNDDVHFHLIEAMDRIMPEVSLKTSQWVVKDLETRGAPIHLNTQLTSAVDGKIEMSTGEKFESDLIVWTAGVQANPLLRNTDLPLEERGRLRLRADLRVETAEGDVVEDAWGAGDATAVPDLTGGGVGGFCVPNAQHAVRQGPRLARNVIAVLRGEEPKEYKHKSIGAVAGLGLWNGVYTNGSKKFALKGWIGWVFHRGYHGLAIPTWERKLRVFGGWVGQFFLGRDIVSVNEVLEPRAAFEEFASRPAPAAPAKKAPAAK